MRPNIVSEASLQTRLGSWWEGIPFFTSTVIIACGVVYLVCLLVGYDSFAEVCFLPLEVISRFQVYRIFTSIIFHGSLLHVLFNMLAFVPLGSELERIMGSIRLFYIVVLLATSNAVIHLLIALIVSYNPILSYPELMHQCAIGFSGVLFSMIVIETSLSGIQSRSVFGLFNVPAKWYALILLVVFQLLMPNVSLLGHLSGILSGFLYTYGFFNIIIPDTSRFSAIESSSWLSTCVRRPKFMMCTGSNVSGHLPTYSSQNTTSSGLLSGNMWRNFSSLLPQRENPPQSMQDDSRFPGAGRTLGSNPNRGSSIGNPDSNLMARLLDDNDSQGHLSAPSLGGQQKPTGRPAAAENTVAAATTRESRHEGHVPSDEDIQKLVAMGFEKTQVEVAVAAADGDLNVAVEILMAQKE
nr:rhomboid-like protein 15 [Ipomoea batatas]